MAERPYSRYTRTKTWAALYSQHINAGYALVPYSTTNNSIDVIRCDSPEDAQKLTQNLVEHDKELEIFYQKRHTPEQAPAILSAVIKAKKLRSAVVLARSSEYDHYHLGERTKGIQLVICGLHDSYLDVTVWETRTNKRYKARETSVSITDPKFSHLRCTQFGHNILIAALARGDQNALTFIKDLPPRTQSRLQCEKDALQDMHYRGRPLAFLTEAERKEVGEKISEGLKRYHERRRTAG